MKKAYVSKGLSKVLSVILSFLMVFSLLPAMAFAAPDPSATPVGTEADLLAALANPAVAAIRLTADIDLSATINIQRPVALDGNDKTIKGPGGDHGIVVLTDDVSITNLTITGSGRSNLQFYKVSGGTVTNVTLSDAKNAGLIVNGSKVAVSHVTTTNNAWGGINVDQGKDVDTPTLLTVADATKHTSPAGKLTPAIWVDKGEHADWVKADGLYKEVLSGGMRNYFDKAEYAAATTKEVSTEAQLNDALANPAYATIRIASDFDLSNTVTINRAVAIDGNEKTIKGPAAAYGFTVLADDVSFSKLTITGSGKSNLNFYKVVGGSLTNVTLANSKNGGMIVNGSKVTVSGVTTTGNAWGGINVDQGSGVTTVPLLTVADVTTHTSPAGKLTAAIWVDKGSNTGWVSAYGKGEYTEANAGAMHQYFDTNEYTAASATVTDEATLRTALAQDAVKIIRIGNDFSVANTVEISREVRIEGHGFTITGPQSGSDPLKGHGFTVLANRVAFSNLIITGSRCSNLQFYKVFGGTLNDVTLSNAANAGLIVNGSQVTVSHVTTTGNAWGGINVDQGVGVTTPTLLTVADVTKHTSPATGITPAIWLDKGTNLSWVSAAGLYAEQDMGAKHLYLDKGEVAAAAELAAAKTAAVAELTDYKAAVSTTYSKANWALIGTKKTAGTTAINAAATKAAVNAALAEAKADIDTVPTLDQEAQAAALNVTNEAQLRAALGNPAVSAIRLAADFAITSTVDVRNPVSIDGQNHTITGPSAGYGFTIYANGVSFSKLTITGSAKSNLNFYMVADGSLSDVTLANSKNAGMIVNGSKVTVSKVTTANNAWGGINVDQGGGVTTPTLLTVTDVTTHSSPSGKLTPAIWVDKGEHTDWVSAPAAAYAEATVAGVHYYYDKAEHFAATTRDVKTEAELNAALANGDVTDIRIANDFAVLSTVIINRPVRIDGKGCTITGPAAGHGFNVLANDVSIANLTITKSAKSNLHFYKVSGGSLTNVTLSDAKNAGLIVNGSKVTVSKVTTSGNAWGGINVDQGSGVTTVPLLTVVDVTTHTSPAGQLTPAIWVDKGSNLDWVSIHGNGWYTETDAAPMHLYYDNAEYAAQQLADAKAAALSTLAAYQATEADYSPANWTLVEGERAAGVTAINAAATTADVADALQDAKDGIDAIQTIAQEAKAAQDAALDVKSEAELNAALASPYVSAIELAASFSLSATVNVNRTVSIDGKDFTITGPAVGHGIVVLANDVSIANLTITKSGRSNLQFYKVSGGSLTDVTLSDAKNAGLIVNGSKVTVSGVTTANNAWGGINVDRGSGVTTDTLLTVTDATTHSSPANQLTPAIWVDKGSNTGWVSAYGNGWYTETDAAPMHLYYDKTEYAKDAALKVSTEAELNAALANPVVSQIQLATSFSLSATVNVNRTVSIDGKGFTITGPASAHGIVVLAKDVSIANLTITKSGKSNLQFYKVSGGTVTNVTLSDAKNAGLIVNGSKVTVSKVTTANNAWGGINVDQGSGVTTDTLLTVADVTTHSSPKGQLTPAIWVDKGSNLDWVSIHGNGWYTETDAAPMHLYYDSAEYAAKELADAQAAALSTLAAYQATEADYSPANWTLVEGERADGIIAINAATSPAAVADALQAAKDGIDAIQTIAQETKAAQDAALDVKSEASLRAALGSQYVSDIRITGNFTLSANVEINRTVSIDGQNHTITGPAAGHGFTVFADDVALSNLTITGSKKTNLNFYLATGGTLSNVTLSNAGNAGMIVNGSTVAVSHVTTSNNAWGGINVDQGVGVLKTPLLTVTDVTAHSSPTSGITPAIWVDKGSNTGWVSAYGNSWYTETNTSDGMHKYYDKAEYEVVKQLTSIAVKTAPKTAYLEGQSFDATGLTLTASYDNGTTATITTGYTITVANPLPVGDSTVTIAYGGKQTTLKITAAAKTLASIAVKTAPKTSYLEGQSFDATDLTLTASYDNGSTATITTGYTIAVANPLPVGDSTVTIAYGGKQTTLKVTVTAKVLTGIAITTKPSKTTYVEGQTFDATGMVVTASYNNGSTAAVTGYTLSPDRALTAADTKVTVSYGGSTADLAITVLSKGSLRLTTKDTIGAIYAGVGLAVYSDKALTHKVGEGVSDASGIVQLTGLEEGTYWVVVASVPAGYKMPSSNQPIDFQVAYGPVTAATLVLEKSKTYAYNSTQLTNIQTSAGTLSPAFDPETLKYTLTLDENTKSAKLTPVLADSASKLTINGRKVASLSVTLDNGKQVKVTIKVQPKTGKALTYTVTVIRDKSSNANLASLKFSKGTLSPAFDPAKTAYTVDLPNTQASVAVTYKLADGRASNALYLDGKKTTAKTIKLNPGQTKTLIVSVKSQKGTITNYTITIRRAVSHNADLASLAASKGTLSPAFAAAQTAYTLALTSAQASTALKVKTADATATVTYKVNGKAASKTITLAKGATKVVTVLVKSQAGDVKTTTVTVTRAK